MTDRPPAGSREGSSAALRRLLDRFLDWRYYKREYRLARMRGQSQYMPPPRPKR